MLEVETFGEGKPMIGVIKLHIHTTDLEFLIRNFHFILRLDSFLAFLKRKINIFFRFIVP